MVWFRRDLRVDDNHALIAASLSGAVVPIFVWSPEEEGQFYPGRASRWWLKKSLKHLSSSLQSLGAPLIVRRSRSTLAVLLEVIAITGATQLFYNHLYGALRHPWTAGRAPLVAYLSSRLKPSQRAPPAACHQEFLSLQGRRVQDRRAHTPLRRRRRKALGRDV